MGLWLMNQLTEQLHSSIVVFKDIGRAFRLNFRSRTAIV